MSKTAHISLQAGERLFLNGAVVRADRRVSLEVLNDVPYLLEHQILMPEMTTTPLRQLYFILQTMVIDPAGSGGALEVFQGTLKAMRDVFTSPEIVVGLDEIDAFVAGGSAFEALKVVRRLYPLENALLGIVENPELRFLEAV